jgi:hypothetical protein
MVRLLSSIGDANNVKIPGFCTYTFVICLPLAKDPR